MGTTNSTDGVIRIGRKGLRKFAFGDDGPVFEVDVVVAFQRWVEIDDGFRTEEDKNSKDGSRSISISDLPAYHAEAVNFVAELGGGRATTAEALDFIARLREQYDELADFFQPKSRREQESLATSEAHSALEFSVEGD